MEKEKSRPRIITLVAVIQALTGLSILAIFLLCGLAALTMPLKDPRNSVEGTRLLGLGAIIAGVWGGGFLLWSAWAFHKLNPTAYRIIRAEAWRPQFFLVTRFGKRLDDPDVIAAFGLSDEADDKGST